VSAVIFRLSLLMMRAPMVPSQCRHVPAHAIDSGTTSGRTNRCAMALKSSHVQPCFGGATPACCSNPML
jgi:hypothetical protein